MTKLREQVTEFHKAFGQAIAERPTVPTDEIARLRCCLIVEEAFEFVAAMTGDCILAGYLQHLKKDALSTLKNPTLSFDVKLPEAADAIADLMYVSEGANLALGIDGQTVIDVVHVCNMKKAGGPKDPVTNKILKPAGWVGPDILGELRRQGFTQ